MLYLQMVPSQLSTASRIFSSDDQTAFAELSGDRNPIHLDQVAARRTPAGAAVVHGMHLLLWAMDSIEAGSAHTATATSISARFPNWAYVGEVAHLTVLSHDVASLRVNVTSRGVVVLSAKFDFILNAEPRPVVEPATLQNTGDVRNNTCREMSLEDIKRCCGICTFEGSAAALDEMFPGACRLLGELEVGGLLATTRIVGMHCPGLYSIFAGLHIETSLNAERHHRLHYSCASLDERFRSVKLDVIGAGIIGTLDVFARWPPTQQPSIATIAQQIVAREFTGSHALVIGGSRGLGEFCAKAIAAGGGQVTITYAQGKADAHRVVEEIEEWGGRCTAIVYDVLKPAEAQIGSVSDPPTALYYFATPSISAAGSQKLDFSKLDNYTSFYIKGLLGACVALRALFKAPMTVFYPSTIYIESRPEGLTEYAMVKAAGEILCQELPRAFSGINMVVRRLPRLLTDQTASLIPIKSAVIADVMIPICREVHSAQRQPAI